MACARGGREEGEKGLARRRGCESQAEEAPRQGGYTLIALAYNSSGNGRSCGIEDVGVSKYLSRTLNQLQIFKLFLVSVSSRCPVCGGPGASHAYQGPYGQEVIGAAAARGRVSQQVTLPSTRSFACSFVPRLSLANPPIIPLAGGVWPRSTAGLEEPLGQDSSCPDPT